MYVIEDLHSVWMWKDKKGVRVGGKDVYDYFGELGREATSHLGTNMGYTTHHTLGQHVASLHFYDSIIFLHYQEHLEGFKAFSQGSQFFLP